ncbi:hypothetical protein [Methylobacterium sp. SD21]|uniref:hypothetical protein n=1 Tax=Methylobacterium litchii TaxID=3138810 RepID=UPI00313DD67E
MLAQKELERQKILDRRDAAVRAADQALRALEASAKTAEILLDAMETITAETGRYDSAKAQALMAERPEILEALSRDGVVKRPRGRPRKDGLPPRTWTDEERAARGERRVRSARGAANKGTDKPRREPRLRPVAPVLDGSQAEAEPVVESGTTDVPSPLAPPSDILIPLEAVTPAPEAAVVETPEPVQEVLPPVIAPALQAAAFLAMGDIDAPEDDEMIEVLTTTDKVIDVFSPAVLTERAARRDFSRWPTGYDPTWADHWERDPYHRLAEMVAEFPCFGAATDKAPGDLTDEEARVLIGSAVFRRPRNFDPKDFQGRLAPPIYSQLTELDPAVWRREIASGGGTLQKAVAAKRLYIDPMREIERSRVRMWPLAVSRRDAIKDYMDALAVGEMTFEPVSDAKADLMRSVRYRVFRGPDHDWVGLPSRQDLEIYYLRILDKLPWPAGLSRIELVERFGQGMSATDIQNMSLMGRPPEWLLPERLWRDIDHGTLDLGNGVTLSIDDVEIEHGDVFDGDSVLMPVVPYDPNAPEPDGDEADET